MEKQIFTATELLGTKYKGFLVIGDVHAYADEFEAALNYARSNDLFTIQLGDLVDRGYDNVKTVKLATEMVGSNRGIFLKGNHDWKHIRYIEGRNVVIHDEHQKTISQFETDEETKNLALNWYEVSQKMPFILIIDKAVFAHAGFHKAFLEDTMKLSGFTKSRALYGEVDKDKMDMEKVARGYQLPYRTYSWTETVPADHKVFVGHSVVATEHIPRVISEEGGESYFTDTGSGFENGVLSWLHFDPDFNLVTSSIDVVDVKTEDLPS